MNNVSTLRKDVKKYIETADDRVVKMVHAMLEADNKIDLWDELPTAVQKDLKEAMKQSAQGKGKPHKEVMKKWGFMKH
jgi:Mg/Co/Ni transporter MgtE